MPRTVATARALTIRPQAKAAMPTTTVNSAHDVQYRMRWPSLLRVSQEALAA